jgi:hypothetical protein
MPLNQNFPKSKAISPFFASLSSALGSRGTKTPTTPRVPVALPESTSEFMTRFGISLPAALWH